MSGSQAKSTLPINHAGGPTWLRPAVQGGFLLATILIGVAFHRFVVSLAGSASGPVFQRPEGVEAFLPISSLMSLTYLAKTGLVNRVHPAGLVIFCLILALAVLMRRGFCSWACPFGTLAEYAHKLGRRLLGSNPALPRWLDISLRSVKYLLLGFFVIVIVQMPLESLREFIYGPYNRVADIKLYLLFARISRTTLVVLLILLALSAIFKNFWCRYLCPYGALLGILSKLSLVRVYREKSLCTGCGNCGRACPNRIPVQARSCVRSAECTACLSCIQACPTPGVLRMSAGKRRQVSVLAYGLITASAFVLAPHAARALDCWRTETLDGAYRRLYAMILTIEHPGGSWTRSESNASAPPEAAMGSTASPPTGGPARSSQPFNASRGIERNQDRRAK